MSLRQDGSRYSDQRGRWSDISKKHTRFGTHSPTEAMADIFEQNQNSIVCGAAQDPEARAILESSVDLGKKLGMSLVAEGVETQED